MGAAEPPLSRFDVVEIKPSTTTVFLATVSMSMPPFVRKGAAYVSSYSVKVFPYFLLNEKGRIWIEVVDADLKRAARGEPVDFKGKAVSESGSVRRVEGHATPRSPYSGDIRVKVIVSRRISLTYETTYDLRGPGAPPALTPR